MQWDDTVPDGAVRVTLQTRRGVIQGYTIVDAADAEWVNQWRWRLLSVGYVYRAASTRGGKKSQMLLLHRELLGLKAGDGLEGDHINRGRLDNRRGNLRIVSKAENRQNRPSYRGTTSRFRGVYWEKQRNAWRARVTANGKTVDLGFFLSEEQAGEVARQARKRLLSHSPD